MYSLNAQLCQEVFAMGVHSQMEYLVIPYLTSYITSRNEFTESLLFYMDKNLDSFLKPENASSLLFSILLIFHTKKGTCNILVIILFLCRKCGSFIVRKLHIVLVL